MPKVASAPSSSSCCLSDLLEIRRQHLQSLRDAPGYLGSAIGLKFLEAEGRFARDARGQFIPVIQLFVSKKQKRPGAGALPSVLSLPDGRSCATDVIEGALLPEERPVPTPSNPGLDALLQRLSADHRIGGGMPILNGNLRGTAACVVSRQGDPRQYLLTNRHVAGFVGDQIEEGSPVSRRLGCTKETYATVSKPPRGSFAGTTTATYHFDAALVELLSTAGQTVEGVHLLPELGEPLQADLKGLSPLGLRVQGVGSSLGLRQGVIMSCAYEFDPDPEDEKAYSLCDYLIMGAESGTWPDEPPAKSRAAAAKSSRRAVTRAFAVPGDSGMLIVTCDAKPRPVALLWGGQKQSFWHAQAQEGWAYATSIVAVMETLKLKSLSPH